MSTCIIVIALLQVAMAMALGLGLHYATQALKYQNATIAKLEWRVSQLEAMKAAHEY